MKSEFNAEIDQYIEDCRILNSSVAELAILIVLGSEKHPDAEVRMGLASLPNEVAAEVRRIVLEYQRTGEYYVISSAGVTRDLSVLMQRVAKMI